jgi:hypothetical protein
MPLRQSIVTGFLMSLCILYFFFSTAIKLVRKNGLNSEVVLHPDGLKKGFYCSYVEVISNWLIKDLILANLLKSTYTFHYMTFVPPL